MTQNDLQSHRAVRHLSRITAVLVVALAAGAFGLSFDCLQQLAEAHGISPGLTWVWPLTLDGSILVFSLSVLRCSLFRECGRYAMGLVVCATGLSLLFNVIHAPEGSVAKLMAAVPPLCLFASFELLVRQVRCEVERRACLSSLHEMSTHLDTLSQQRDSLAGQIEKLSVHRETLKLEIRQAKSANVHELLSVANQAREDKIQRRAKLVADMAGQGKSPSEIALVAGVSAKTVKRDLLRLRAA